MMSEDLSWIVAFVVSTKETNKWLKKNDPFEPKPRVNGIAAFFLTIKIE